MKMTTKFYETTIKETEHEIKEIDSKLQSNLPSTEYSAIKEQVSKNPELTIQQLKRKKTCKYRQLKYGETNTKKKQTRNSSVKFSQPNLEEKINNNNQYNTKRTYAAALRSNRPTEQQIQTETKKPTA